MIVIRHFQDGLKNIQDFHQSIKISSQIANHGEVNQSLYFSITQLIVGLDKVMKPEFGIIHLCLKAIIMILLAFQIDLERFILF